MSSMMMASIPIPTLLGVALLSTQKATQERQTTMVQGTKRRARVWPEERTNWASTARRE